MTKEIKLADLGERDVLLELQDHIAQIEVWAQTGSGYGPCLEFYKRIAKRIEDSDDVLIDARSRAGKAFKAVQDADDDSDFMKDLYARLGEDMQFLEDYLVTLEDTE